MDQIAKDVITTVHKECDARKRLRYRYVQSHLWIVPAMIREAGGREIMVKKHINTGEISSISEELPKFTIRLNIPGTGIRISSLLMALLTSVLSNCGF
jgi:predicted kinase